MKMNLLHSNHIDTFKPLRFILSFILFISICFASIPIFAAADTKVYDYANLLTIEEIDTLEASANKLAETYQMDIGIVTINDAEGKSSMAYADDFYDYNGYGYGSNHDGLLFLIDMDNREIYISTCGLGIEYFTDSRIDKMLDKLINYMADGDYYGVCTDFLTLTESYIQKGIPGKHTPFTASTGEPLNSKSITLSIIVALLGAGLIAFIVRFFVKRSYTHPHYNTPVTKPDTASVQYTQREDHFVNSHTTRVKIETHTNSSGGSSTHTSSSGRSHGGGGRGF